MVHGRLPALLLAASLVASCGAGRKLRAFDAVDTSLTGAIGTAAHTIGERMADQTMQTAHAAVHAAVPGARSGGASLLRLAFIDAVRRHDMSRAARLRALWIVPADDVKATMASVEWTIATGHYDSARSQAWAAVEAFPEQRPALMRLWYAAWAADPTFLSDVATIEAGEGTDRIEHLGGGSSITFRLLDHGVPVAAFKPFQTRRQSNYRGELAAYRLCALIHCRFEVPRNAEVRIARDTLLALNGRTSARDIARFDRQYDDLIWFEDGAGRQWLHGTAKAWVPGFRLFAIEFRDVWRPLVRIDGPEPVEVDLDGLMARAFNTRRYAHPRAAGDLGDLDVQSLATQLSNLHVFDFLLNNWDRYSGEYWGVNCQWSEDHFVSIDNGAAFPPLEQHGVFSSRPRRNLQQVERFSRRTIDAVRWMEPTAVYPLLFPPSEYHHEKADFAAFEQRRQWLLEYVDDLISEYGEDAVLAFR